MAFVQLPGVAQALIMARVGWDGLIFDWQHGALDFAQIADAIAVVAGAGTPAWVRVAANEPGAIGQLLDAGATGIICPLVESRLDAERLVSACRYPPQGRRSLGPLRAELLRGHLTTEQASMAIRTFAIIESPLGMAHIEEIVATPGLDGILVGIADLALSEGRPFRGYDDPQTRRSTEVAARVTEGAGRMLGVPLIFGQGTSFVCDLQPDLIVAGTDVDFLRHGARCTIERLRLEGPSREDADKGTAQ
jgi:4-hydroxy-2-oxoheptanedioate aldolase